MKVLYHAGCPDGFGAAWAFRRWCVAKYLSWDGRVRVGAGLTTRITEDIETRALNGVEFIPVTHHLDPPDGLDGSDVYMLDFSYERERMDEIKRKARSLIVFDHHKKTARDLVYFPGVIHDQKRSGAGITWDELTGETRPALVNIVEDRDLWRFSMPNARKLAAWLWSFPMEFGAWDQIHNRLEIDMEGCVQEATHIYRFLVESVIAQTRKPEIVSFGGYHNIPIVNATAYGSDVAERLLMNHESAPFSAYYKVLAGGLWQYGLRGGRGVDVDLVAGLYGGGGHEAASGFVWDGPVWEKSV